MDFRDWKMGVAIPAVLVTGCEATKPAPDIEWTVKPAPKPAAAPEPTPESLAAEYAHARAEADRWTKRWKAIEALRAAMVGKRSAEEVAKRREEYDACR